MNSQHIHVVVLCVIMVSGFVYVNFIFPKQIEKEKIQNKEILNQWKIFLFNKKEPIKLNRFF